MFCVAANLAMISGIVLWVVPPFALFLELMSTNPMEPLSQMVTCLSPPVCLSWGFSIFMNKSKRGLFIATNWKLVIDIIILFCFSMHFNVQTNICSNYIRLLIYRMKYRPSFDCVSSYFMR